MDFSDKLVYNLIILRHFCQHAGRIILSMDKERFQRAIEAASARQRGRIGTLGEKGVHNTLKHYYEPDTDCHEIAVGGYVADIVGENGIIEIQSASFGKLREKLRCFLAAARVTVVWPCVVNKRIIRVDTETGEIVSERRSNVHRGEYDIFRELWSLREFLCDPRLTICIARLEADEYRPAEMRRGRGRKGANNGIERYPTMLAGELILECPEDYLRFVPTNLPEQYNSKDFAKAAGVHLSIAQSALLVLTTLGVVERCGKQGNSYIYKTIMKQEAAPRKIQADGNWRLDVNIMNQPLDGLDGQMCIAMAAGREISEVIEKTGCGRREMNLKKLMAALDAFGIAHAESIKQTRGKRVTLPECCIISEHGHFLLQYCGVYYDNEKGVFSEYDQSRMSGYIELFR